MDTPSSFESMVERLRAGESDAVREFVDRFEPLIRRTIRRRLAGTPLQAAADSVDICQSAMGSFLIRAAAGEFKLATAHDLEKLLLTIARRKLAALARHETADRRDRRRLVSSDIGSGPTDDSRHNPLRAIVNNDLLDQVHDALSSDEQQLFQLRRAGHDWESIAGKQGGTPVLLRKRLSRALRRVSAEMGLEDDDA